MNANVNILCYKSKTLSNGEHPLMIRVCKDGKKKYQSLGIYVHPIHWDFQKNNTTLPIDFLHEHMGASAKEFPSPSAASESQVDLWFKEVDISFFPWFTALLKPIFNRAI